MSTDGPSSVHIPQLTQAPLAGPPLARPHTNRTLADRNLKESPTPLGFILAAPKELTACCSTCLHTLHSPLARPHATHARPHMLSGPSVSATQASLRLFSRRLWNSEHVIAIVHAYPATSHALNPALTLNSVWGGH